MQHERRQGCVVHFWHEYHGVGTSIKSVGRNRGAVVSVESMHQTNDLTKASEKGL
jgi:lysophospholipid acyltransferase (LPLAT)-like uncharacterized protein